MRLYILSTFLLIGTWIRAESFDLQSLDSIKPILVGEHFELYEDCQSKAKWPEVSEKQFQKMVEAIHIASPGKCSYWYRLNLSSDRALNGNYFLEVRNPLLDTVEVYLIQNGKTISTFLTGDHLKFHSRPLNFSSFIFPLRSEYPGNIEVYLRIRSSDQMIVPLFLGGRDQFTESKAYQDLIFGMYMGLMLVMFLYNAFIFFTTKDRSYLFYIIYILALLLTQMLLEGFAFHRLIPNNPELHNFGVVLFSALTGWAAIAFARSFLRMRETSPFLHRGLYVFQALYVMAVIFRLSNKDVWSFQVLDFAGMTSTIYGLVFSITLVRKGVREARFYLVAWIFFIFGIMAFVLKNLGILPFNSLTSSSIQIGSAAEIILLSFALGDRINRLRKEREEAQRESLALLSENERIIKEQNIILEQKVEERTYELQEINEELKITLDHLKDTQAQLVDAEKMASLGQLTAGIAHEINNPINFVSSNIEPLKRDIEDLIELIQRYQNLEESELSKEERSKLIEDIIEFKDEIDLDYISEEISQLINGIQNGAERTTDIVRGLRTFSRLDENDLKEADIELGLDSTLTLLGSKLRGHIELRKEYEGIPMIFCNAGKLNQVFMNLITNSIQAIEERQKKELDHQGVLTVRTLRSEEFVCVEIEDNGAGMSEEVKKRVFEPFFTTKAVGEGTGLGLSIAYKILQQHNAVTQINTDVGKGCKFSINLPIKPLE